MRAAVLLLCAASVACSGGRRAERPSPSASRNVILEEELRQAPGSNLYDIIRTIRPEWLRRNPTVLRAGAEGDIVVYLDRTRMGDPSALRQMRTSDVVLVRYYSPSEAAGEFGPGHLHGAIQALTRRP